MNKKISFDFDSTLTKPCIQRFAKKLIQEGYEIFIITTRCASTYGMLYDNSDLFEVSDRIGVKRCNIIFTQANYKYKYIDNTFLFHIDDDINELNKINNIPTVNVNDSFSIKKCFDILESKNE